MNKILTYPVLISILNICISLILNPVIAHTEPLSDSRLKDPMEQKINEALQYYKKSISEKQNPELSLEYLEISKSKLKSVELMIETRLLDSKKSSLEEKLISMR